jgi:hypothetical protein
MKESKPEALLKGQEQVLVLVDYVNKALYNLAQANRMEDILSNG